METNRLRQFRVVVETGNLRKAAELLGISHSGLSKSMKALEAELGFGVFHPSGRGIVISDEGKRLYERSGRFLEEYDRLLGVKAESVRSALRIGSFETFTSYFIGPLLKTYLPDHAVEVHELVPGRLEEALVFSKVDLGITYEPVPRNGIEYVKAASLHMGVYARQGSFSGQEISEVPFIIPVIPLEGAPSGVKGRDAWPDEKIKRNVRYRVDHLTIGLELARQGLGAIFIPRFVARLHNDHARAESRLAPLKVTKKMGSIRRDVFIVKRESTAEDQVIRQIARALRTICADEDQ